MNKTLRRAINSSIIMIIGIGVYSLGKVGDSNSILWMFGIGFFAVLYFQDNDFFADYPGRKTNTSASVEDRC